MSRLAIPPLPRAARPFVTFGHLLRSNGFAVAPEQTVAFVEAVALLGPRSMQDIRRAAHAMLAPPAERLADFDALFNAHFLDAAIPRVEAADDDEALKVQEDQQGGFELPDADDVNETGQTSTGAEALSAREISAAGEEDQLRRFARLVPKALPRRRGYRWAAARSGTAFDLRRALRVAVRHDGELIEVPTRNRKTRARNLLLLIDVSGSMKQQSEANLRFAHTLVQAAERIEVFTFGTRLTRVTRALKLKNREQALATTSATVSDWDGGTRIGDALRAFLAVPRFAGYARGAAVVMISDGLERGEHAVMTEAVARIRALAWRLAWLTPLAAGQHFKPETAALKSILPYLDHIGDGSSTASLVREFLSERAA